MVDIKKLFKAGLLEYSLIAIPTEPVYSQIISLKEAYKEKVGWSLYSKTKPHFTLCKFMSYPSNENKIIAMIK